MENKFGFVSFINENEMKEMDYENFKNKEFAIDFYQLSHVLSEEAIKDCLKIILKNDGIREYVIRENNGEEKIQKELTLNYKLAFTSLRCHGIIREVKETEE